MTSDKTARERVRGASNPRLYTVAEVASLWSISTRTVYRLIEAGDLKTVTIPGRGTRDMTRVAGDELNRYITRKEY